MRIKQNGYSADLAKLYVPDDTEVLLLSTKPEPRYKWENGKPTDEVTGYKILCAIPGDYFYVKFAQKPKNLPSFGTKVTFDDLQACEVGQNVYFKANAIRKEGD